VITDVALRIALPGFDCQLAGALQANPAPVDVATGVDAIEAPPAGAAIGAGAIGALEAAGAAAGRRRSVLGHPVSGDLPLAAGHEHQRQKNEGPEETAR
jgi:hypothetical protein